MLASYADNGLSADQRRLVEAHAADCTTCLEHLALLGAVSVEREAPEPSRSWLARWGWLVPVATAVLVVAVWMRLPEEKATQGMAPAAPEQERAAAASPSAERDMASHPAPRVGAKVAQAAPERLEQSTEAKFDELAPLERRDTARQTVATEPPAVASAPPAAPAVQAREAGQKKARDLQLGGATSKVATPRAAAAPAMADAMKEEVETYRARGNRVEQSRDGGTTWSSVLSEPQSTFTVVGCAQGGPCWIGTADGQILRRVPDGFSRSVLPVRVRVVAIAPDGPQTAVVTVEGGKRFRTADGGATWQPIP